jgi:hypothetical protein
MWGLVWLEPWHYIPSYYFLRRGYTVSTNLISSLLLLDIAQRLRILDGAISLTRSSGGSDGCRTINRFLMNVSDYLAEDGFVLLGSNEFYVPRIEIEHLVSQNSLKVIETLGYSLTMSYVLVIGKLS